MFSITKKGDTIDINSYTKSLKALPSEELGLKSLEEVKKELESLHEYNIVFEELEKANLYTQENSMHLNNNIFIQTSSIITDVKEKQEITRRLGSLSYTIGWLKSAISVKDQSITSKAIESVLKNKYSSISSIVNELNSLKSGIEKLENVHSELLNSGLSLDVKTLMEQDFSQKHKKLKELHSKQKSILLNLSNIFAVLAKDSVREKRK